jgi:hypothetical protein
MKPASEPLSPGCRPHVRSAQGCHRGESALLAARWTISADQSSRVIPSTRAAFGPVSRQIIVNGTRPPRDTTSPILRYRIGQPANSVDDQENHADRSGSAEQLQQARARDFPRNSCRSVCTRTKSDMLCKCGLQGLKRTFRSLDNPGQETSRSIFEQGLCGPAAKAVRIMTWSLQRNHNALAAIRLEDCSVDCQVQTCLVGFIIN